MIAIYKRELKSYFNSMIGYVAVGIFLLVVGFYFWGFNLSGKSPAIGNTLSGISLVYAVILPILTMRSLAEEQKQKTDQLLFSSPVSIGDVVLGKFFAIVTIFTIPMLVICTMPLVLSQFGTVAFLKSYSSILAFWLLGCVMIALGVLISSLTENQIIAAVVTFGFILVIFLMQSIASIVPESGAASLAGFSVVAFLVALFLFLFSHNIIVSGGLFAVVEIAMVVVYFVKGELFESAFANALSSVSFYVRFSDFVSGTFNAGSIVYYISFIGLFLYLAMQSVQKRRWS